MRGQNLRNDACKPIMVDDIRGPDATVHFNDSTVDSERHGTLHPRT
jgi:hypothetical protein